MSDSLTGACKAFICSFAAGMTDRLASRATGVEVRILKNCFTDPAECEPWDEQFQDGVFDVILETAKKGRYLDAAAMALEGPSPDADSFCINYVVDEFLNMHKHLDDE